jgi:hypothetical protein
MSCADCLAAGIYGKDTPEDHITKYISVKYESTEFVCSKVKVKELMRFLEQKDCHVVRYYFLNINGKQGYWVSGFRKDNNGSHRIAADLPPLNSKGKLNLCVRVDGGEDLLGLESVLGIKLTHKFS